MSRYRFEVAGPEDDADLRHILAATPMDGPVRVSFRREPSYFAGACVDGRFRQAVAARDLDGGRLVAFGSRSVMPRFVNGRPEPVGYLSSLRILADHRNRGVLARGYAHLRKLHQDGRTRLYLTTIAEGNRLAQALLTSGRAGLPAYHFAGRYHTLAIPLGSRQTKPAGPTKVDVRPARAEDLARVVDFLRKEGPRRQFFPAYEASDFGAGPGIFKDLRPEGILLAWRGDELVGTLAGWDQRGFRQTVVDGYGPVLRWTRPLYNAWARLRGLPGLPRPGEPFRYLTAALLLVAGDDLQVFAALAAVLRGRAAAAGHGHLLLGLHEGDPLLEAVRSWEATRYTTHLYLACWEDGEGMRKGLDGRPPYLELGSL